MGVPSCLTRNHAALHCTVSRNHILNNTGQHMANVRLAVGGWRSIIKCIGFPFLTAVHTFFKNFVFFPELLDLFFTVHKVQVRIYFLIHDCFLLIIKEPSSCKRTRAESTLLRTTCYTIRAESCRYLSHLTAGTPSVPTFFQFRERNSGVIFGRSYLHRASTCPRLSAAFDFFSVTLKCLRLTVSINVFA